MSRREEAESQPAEGHARLDHRVVPPARRRAISTPKVLNLELLAYNFHDSLNLKPLFLDLQRRFRRSQTPTGVLSRAHREPRGERDHREAALLARGTRQELPPLGGPRGAARPGPAGRPAGAGADRGRGRALRGQPARAAASTRPSSCTCGSRSKRPEGRRELPDTRATFNVGFFDFPMIDNTRLANGLRCAVTLSELLRRRAPTSRRLLPRRVRRASRTGPTTTRSSRSCAWRPRVGRRPRQRPRRRRRRTRAILP